MRAHQIRLSPRIGVALDALNYCDAAGWNAGGVDIDYCEGKERMPICRA